MKTGVPGSEPNFNIPGLNQKNFTRIELKESRQLLQSIFDLSSGIITVMESVRNEKGEIIDFRYIFSNDPQNNKNENSKIGQLYTAVFPGINTTTIYRRFIEVVTEGERLEYETSLQHDGKATWFHIVAVKLNDGFISITQDVTARKEAEAKIKEQSHFIEQVMETVPDLITVTDLRTDQQIFLNRNPFPDGGVSKEDILKMSPEEKADLFQIHPEDIRKVKTHYTSYQFLSDHEFSVIEYRARYGSKEWKWFLGRGRVFQRNRGGEATHIINIVQDITNRKTVELQVKDQLHFINQVAVTIPDMLSVMDLENHSLSYVNKDPFILNGFDYDELTRSTLPQLYELIHPEDRDQMARYFENFRSYDDNEIQSLDFRGKNSSGEWLWFRARGKVFKRNKDGLPTHCVNLVQNINDRKKALSELKDAFDQAKRKESLLQEAEKIGLIGSWEKNIETRQLSWSDELYRMFGLDPQCQKVTSDFYVNNFVHPEDRKKAIDHLKDLYENFNAYPIEYRILTSYGERIVLSQPKILRDEEGKPKVYVGIIRDITAQKKAEEELVQNKLQQQKEILNAMLQAQENERERIGEALHNGVAQLLYAAQTRLQLLNPVNEQEKNNLKEILAIVSDAINDTRNISFELVPAVLKDYGIEVALKALLQKIIKEQPNVQIHLHGIKHRLPETIEFAIYRITQELVNNIIKHSRASKANIDLSLKLNILTLVVKDNGIGFKQREARKLNKGIGLQSVKNRVKLMNGSVSIKSPNGKGTAIIVHIPLAKIEAS